MHREDRAVGLVGTLGTDTDGVVHWERQPGRGLCGVVLAGSPPSNIWWPTCATCILRARGKRRVAASWDHQYGDAPLYLDAPPA